MKRGWVAAALALIAVILAAAEWILINADTESFIGILDEADAHMESGETAEAYDAAKRLERRFDNRAHLYNMFMFHNEVSTVSGSLASMCSYARDGESAEYSAESAEVRKNLNILRNARIPSAENIF